MKKKFFLFSTIIAIAVIIIAFIGCGGGGGDGDSGGGADPTQTPTSTGTPYDNTYRVLAGADSSRAGVSIIILPADASIPTGYTSAPYALIRFINKEGLLITVKSTSNGEFDAEALGIPGITGVGNIDSIANVDVSYNGQEETNIPLPVFEGNIPSSPGPIKLIKVLPPITMMPEGAKRPFFCIGVTENGMIVRLTNVKWTVDDENTIKILETPDNGGICVVEAVKGGIFPEPAFAYLTAEAKPVGPTPTGSPTIQPTSSPTSSPEPTPLDGREPLVDIAKVGVITPPETDATISGQLLDKDSSPVPNARMIFRSSQVPTENREGGQHLFMVFPAHTDEQGNYNAKVMSGQSYSVIAMTRIQEPVPTSSPYPTEVPPIPFPTSTGEPSTLPGDDQIPKPTPTQSPGPGPNPTQSPGPGPGPGPEPGQEMRPFRTTPDPYGPVQAGENTQDFTLAGPIGPGPTPTPPPPPTPLPTPTVEPTPPIPTPTEEPTP